MFVKLNYNYKSLQLSIKLINNNFFTTSYPLYLCKCIYNKSFFFEKKLLKFKFY